MPGKNKSLMYLEEGGGVEEVVDMPVSGEADPAPDNTGIMSAPAADPSLNSVDYETFQRNVFGAGLLPKGMSESEYNLQQRKYIEDNPLLTGEELASRKELGTYIDFNNPDQNFALTIAMSHFGIDREGENHEINDVLQNYANGHTELLHNTTYLNNSRFIEFLDSYANGQRIMKEGVKESDLREGQTVEGFLTGVVDPFSYALSNNSWEPKSGFGPESSYDFNQKTRAPFFRGAFVEGHIGDGYAAATQKKFDFDPRDSVTASGAKKMNSLMRYLVPEPYNWTDSEGIDS